MRNGGVEPMLLEMIMTSIYKVPLFVGGEWLQTGDTIPINNPANGAVVGAVSVAGQPQLQHAVDAAAHGFKIWKQTSPCKRCEIILKAAALMRERTEEIARSITLENGQPLSEARAEVIRVCEFLEWDAGESVRFYGWVIPSALRRLPGRPRTQEGTAAAGEASLVTFSTSKCDRSANKERRSLS
jgi:acyl-CoA reductase-like NAD-dependent aldehyde dehydrogenase